MSADNCIAILKTTSSWSRRESGVMLNLFDKPIAHYRVAHVQAIDNFDWYEDNQIYNLGAYIAKTWPEFPIYLNHNDALDAALKMEKEIGYTEYGVYFVDASQYHYPGE